LRTTSPADRSAAAAGFSRSAKHASDPVHHSGKRFVKIVLYRKPFSQEVRKMIDAVRRTAVFLVLTVSLHGEKISILRSLDADVPVPLTLSVATDSTGVYTVNVSGSRFVLRKLDPAGDEVWTTYSDEAHWVTAMVTVAGGSIYVAGEVEGAAPGLGAGGGFDIYVARYDGAVNQLWMRQFGASGDEETGGMADGSGVYITSAVWVFAQQTYTASLRKYSPEGNLQWTRDFTGLSFWSMPLAADGNSLYLAAGTGRDGTPWSNGQPAFAFIRKYNLDGSEQWTQRFAAQPGAISGLAVNRSGVYAILESFSASGNNSTVRKYDADSNELWVRPLGALGNTGLPLRAVTADATGLYVSGSARGPLPGQCYAGNDDAVVRKYEITSGDEIWTREFGTYQFDAVGGLPANAGGVFVLAGRNVAKLVTSPPADSGPRIVNECVLNAASHIGGGVVPGEIVTVAVSGRVTRLLFNGLPAPIFAASDESLTALVPFELAGQAAVQVQVESEGIVSDPVTLPVFSDRLGVFSADRSGNGQAAVVNEDGSLNSPSHPALRGSVISLYATGGAANAVAVAISNEIKAFPEVDGGAEDYRYYAPILYAGASGWLIQINVRVPASVPPGSAVPLHIMAGGVPIEQSPTIAIGQ
jgi:uncharacterized protein (TIGR03437 family)